MDAEHKQYFMDAEHKQYLQRQKCKDLIPIAYRMFAMAQFRLDNPHHKKRFSQITRRMEYAMQT